VLRVTDAEKYAAFGRIKGLHSTYDTVVRYDVKWLIERHEIRVETVSDGFKRVRADAAALGPEQWRLTWAALAKIVMLCVMYHLPIERVAKLFGRCFSDVQISRWLRQVATWLLPVYLELAEQLAQADILSLDDSRTRVIEMRRKAERGLAGTDGEELDGLVAKVAEALGRTYPRADGKGEMKDVQISLISGRSHAEDPRSTINLYRTHYGDAGNLLSRLLSMRRPSQRRLTLQGDLSRRNLPEPRYFDRFDIGLAGCGAHSRRPFARHAEDDDELCDYMLRGFAMLSHVERRIDEIGRTRETVLRLRRKYGRKIWNALVRRAKSVDAAESPSDCRGHRLWPRASELRVACRYIVKHEAKLTRYLDDPRLPWTNNRLERLLRAEVLLKVACKFRLTEAGRAVFDIVRTIAMTCRSAGVPLADYLRYVYRHRADTDARPDDFTPYAYRLRLDAEAAKAAAEAA
jgi:hypothetical protein